MKTVSTSRKGRALAVANRNLSFEIDTKTGMIGAFRVLNSDHAQWDDVIDDKPIYRNSAGLCVKDDLDEKQYSDPFGPGQVFYHEPRKLADLGRGSSPGCGKVSIAKEDGGVRIRFSKSYKGAPFVLENDLLVTKDLVRWDVVLRLRPGQKERSVLLEFSLPMFRSVNGGYFPRGWKVWAALQDAPFDFGHIGGWGHSQASWYVHRFPYCSINAGAGIGLPLMDVYNTARDFGLALAAPLDLNKPELVFVADKENSRLKLTYGNVGLRRGKPWRTSLLLFPHKGDWREALRWFHSEYKDYFTPNNRKIVEQEGTMFYGVPSVPEKTIKSWVKHMGLKWTEVLYNPIFGDHVPDRAVWDFDMLTTPQFPQRIVRGLTKEKVRDYLAMLRKHGVASFVYFNYGECDKGLALKEFPESIIRTDHGMRGAWVFPDGKRTNLTMNPDPESRWGKFVLRQAEELFDTYDCLDGLFVDQICYHSYDYSKDDGMTMVHNVPVMDTHEASCRMMAKIAAILKRRNKTSFANGPYNIEVMKDVDGIMSEGSVSGLAKYSYLCLEKPVMVLCYNKFGIYLEKILKWCLRYGAFASTPWHHTESFNPPAVPPRETLVLYQKYLPLLETMRGRRWVLSSDPVTFPVGLDGNIFHRRGGGYVIPFYVDDALLSNKFWSAREPREITVRAGGLAKVKHAKWLSVSFNGAKTLPVRHSGKELKICVPHYSEASVLLL